MPDGLAAAAESLLSQLVDRSIPPQLIDSFLVTHAPCFEGEMCEICEFIEDNGLDDVLATLAENPALSPEQQDRVMKESFKWQGRQYEVAFGFVLNPNICDDLVEMIVDSPSWFWLDGSDELLPGLVKVLEQNPRFRASDISRFRNAAAEAGIDLDTD